MAGVEIQVETARMNMGPTGFIVYASDFLDAYKKFETDKAFSPAKYYLACRAVELSLKAFLSLSGVSFNVIKNKLQHDLDKILRKSKELGIDSIVPITENEKIEIVKANGWYSRKGFEYFAIQNMVESKDSLPNINVISNLAEKLISVLEPKCFAS